MDILRFSSVFQSADQLKRLPRSLHPDGRPKSKQMTFKNFLFVLFDIMLIFDVSIFRLKDVPTVRI